MVHSREHLVRHVWPDKRLYGSILLLVTSLLGALFALMQLAVDVRLGPNVPAVLRDASPTNALVLSIVAAVGAYVALRQRKTTWAFVGAVAGVLSFGFLGVASLVSLIAFVFLVLARMEGEDENPETLALDRMQWPDKALSASLVLLLAGVFALAWGYGLVSDSVVLSIPSSETFGLFTILVGLVDLAAAAMLSRQRAPMLGFAAAVGSILAFSLYVIGPILGVTALVLLVQAKREDEFEEDAPGHATG
ncbi:MAG: hypothetical protein ACYDCK_13385 [Thermoplasmatota archaeon]